VAVSVEVGNCEVAAAREGLLHEVVELTEGLVAYRGESEMGLGKWELGEYRGGIVMGATFFVVFCNREISVLDCGFYHPVAELALFSVVVQKYSQKKVHILIIKKVKQLICSCF
jgi:hypothetical protein